MDAVLFFICTLSAVHPRKIKMANSSVDLTSTNKTDDVKMLFKKKCATYHGEEGTAETANATNLRTSKLDSITTLFSSSKLHLSFATLI